MKTITLTPNNSIDEIQKALNNQNTKFIFEGTFYITKTLYVHSNTTIDAYKARFIMGAKIHNLFMTYTTSNTTGYNGVTNFKMYGGIIEGMKKYNVNLNLFTFWHSSNCLIKDVTFRDVVGFHSIEINGSNNIQIINCVIEGYSSDTSFREMIQLDFSSESAIFVHKSKSKCYDLTTCKNILIKGCIFKASKNRESFFTAIGNHTQPINKFHQDITIEGCKFYGRNTSSPCIRLVSMRNVTIKNCNIETCGRFVQISNYEYSYDKRGYKATVKGLDGISKDILITNNLIKNASGTNKCTGIITASKTSKNHSNINVKNNTFIKSNTNKNESHYAWLESVDNYVDSGNIYEGLKLYKK